MSNYAIGFFVVVAAAVLAEGDRDDLILLWFGLLSSISRSYSFPRQRVVLE